MTDRLQIQESNMTVPHYILRLTPEEVQHTEAWLRASAMEMTPELRHAWRQTPVGRVADKLREALDD